MDGDTRCFIYHYSLIVALQDRLNHYFLWKHITQSLRHKQNKCEHHDYKDNVIWRRLIHLAAEKRATVDVVKFGTYI